MVRLTGFQWFCYPQWDAWTLSNGYALLAIVMHYILKEWLLEEMLIDFWEIVGNHSGENMAPCGVIAKRCTAPHTKYTTVTC
jgi:hypothetical protein